MVTNRLESLQRVLPQFLEETLPPLLGPLDAPALRDLQSRVQWVELSRGETLFQEGAPADAWFVVMHGRLRLAGSTPELARDIGRGGSLGETALLGGTMQPTQAHALRDSVLLRFDAGHVEELVARHPGMLRALSRRAVRGLLAAVPAEEGAAAALCFAVVPLREGVPLHPFTAELVAALTALGPTLHLSPHHPDTASLLDRAETDPAWLAFSASLDRRARGHRFMVLEGDAQAGVWNRWALQEADQALLVANAQGSPWVDAFEGRLLDARTGGHHAPRTLVLLHPPGTTLPQGTARWLDARDVQHHQHVRAGNPADVARIARTLAGCAVGLVLGAGGARGYAHIGVLQALEESGLPIDHLGGTSVGAVAAALRAMGRTPAEMRLLGREATRRAPFSDFTLPVTSLLNGGRVEALIQSLFGNVHIEDLWVPFFCTSCDLSRFEDVVYARGPLVECVLASAALPGVLPPQVRNGRIMVDGGTTDVLPGRLMRQRCQGTLIAVDVSQERELDYAADRYPTSWRALWERTRPGGRPTPMLPELFLRAASFGLARRVSEVAQDADLFLRPPVERFGTSQVEAGEEMERLGYEHARARLVGFQLKGPVSAANKLKSRAAPPPLGTAARDP